MEQHHRGILRKNQVALVQNLIVDEELLSVLRLNETITDEMKQKIENKETEQGKAACLLEILPRRGKRAFGQFIKSLRETEQGYLASLLLGQPATDQVELDDADASSSWMNDLELMVTNIEAEGQGDNPGIMEIQVKPMTESQRSRLRQQLDVYPMNPERKALAYIINNQYFSHTLQARSGSDCDLKNFKNLFEKLNFHVVTKDNLTVDGIKAIIKTAKQQLNVGSYDLFTFCIMSHGASGVVFGSDAEELNIYSDILDQFSDENCPSMSGKPKLFFIQACQGNQRTSGVSLTHQPDQTDGMAAHGINLAIIDGSNNVWKSPDILLAFATAEGFEAWRHSERGSWFIRTVVYVFSKRACQDHIVDLMTQVCNIVSHFRTKGHKTQFIQIAERKDTLSKKLYLLS